MSRTVAEKIVKITPWPYDDIAVDIIGMAIKKLSSKREKI